MGRAHGTPTTRCCKRQADLHELNDAEPRLLLNRHSEQLDQAFVPQLQHHLTLVDKLLCAARGSMAVQVNSSEKRTFVAVGRAVAHGLDSHQMLLEIAQENLLQTADQARVTSAQGRELKVQQQ